MKFQSVKGINDILPEDAARFRMIEDAARAVFEAYGFDEVRIPIMEYTEVFARGIGATTDIVEKEMYTFPDRDGRQLTLRPEGTASVVRAYIEHSLYAQRSLTKLYYMGPMFRHERPQAGRYRQFHQVGVEALGSPGPLIDVEVLAMLVQLLARLGLDEPLLQINSLGDAACRPVYRKALQDYFGARLPQLCEDCRRRFQTNPLRILDCKQPGCRAQLEGAPSPRRFLCDACRAHFEAVQNGLSQLKIKYEVNDRLVRGLDYYMRTAFEVTTTRLGAQNAVAAGGRYDGLVEELGGPPTPGIGFALGVERLAALLPAAPAVRRPELFAALLGDAARDALLPVVMRLRERGLRVEIDYAAGGLKKQMALADKLGARFTLIVGDNELAAGRAPLRNMEDKSQVELALAELEKALPLRLGR
jgi:histidyl-tRNA synthetase